MKSPEEYFNIKKEDKYTIYEWRDSARLTVAGLIAIGLLVMSFIKTFIDQAVPPYIFMITFVLALAILLIFWVYDRFRLVVGNEEIFVSRGAHLLLGAGLGTRYLKKDFESLYIKSPSNFNNFDFGNDTKIICLQLKSNRRIRLTNDLLTEHADFLIAEMKVFFIFSDRPTPVNLKMGPKLLLAWVIMVTIGALTPRLLEVGEYALEKQSDPMRVAAGLLGMSFMFWILTSTDAIFKEGELTQGYKVLIFVMSLAPTALILGYLYLW